MTRAFTTLAFSPSVRATQARYGSRERMEQVAAREPDRAALSEEMQERLRRANSVIIGTASRDGWPHVQHRGGPRGFIKVLAPDELAFADYSGNRQYISVGNLAENDRMFLLLLDYAERTRLKIWGRGEAIDDDPALLERVRDPDYPARGRTRDPHARRGMGHQLQQPHPTAGAGDSNAMAERAAAATALPEAKATHLGIVLGLAMGPAVGLGLGRFAYALLLPSMRLELGLELRAGGRDEHRQRGGLSDRRPGGGAARRAVRRQARLPAGAAADRGLAAGDRD